MQFPKKAIFAFNANIDHVIATGEAEIEKVDRNYPEIASAMSESFGTGMQREIPIGVHECNFLLSSFKSRKITGGQAGNAAEQASALGVECYLHSNFANSELLGLFSHKERLFSAGQDGFHPASQMPPSEKASARHFVFENVESRTRFIASFDPFPPHPEDSFCQHITAHLPSVGKAFVGGLHLVRTPDRVRKFVDEIKRWKAANPSMQVFLEMGEFQSGSVLSAVRDGLFPIADFVGLNEVELGALGCSPEELAEEAKAVLFHTADTQAVYPREKENAPALEFAVKAVSFRAANGRCGNAEEISGFSGGHAELPAWTVGLGDTLSCAYFMSI